MEKVAINSHSHQVAEVELVYKSKVKASDRPQVRTSEDAAQLFLHSWDGNKIDFIEQCKVLFLNRANRVLALYVVSTGGGTGTVVDIRLIFIAALKLHACNIILGHNHPSCNLKPSNADEELTQKVKRAGCFLDIKLLDHIIISSDGYYSFADEGNL